MAGRKIRDEGEARLALDAVARSGQRRAEWAREHGIDGRSLNAWRMNLERRGAEGAERGLRLVELVPTERHRPARSARYRVRCGPFVVEVDAGFEDDSLGRLLAVVAGC